MPSYALTRRTLLGAALASTATFSFAQVEKPSIKFSQGWLFQATQASFSVAEKNGYYKAEGLTVDIDRGAGSSASVQRVVSGTHDLAYADVGTIVKWNAENPDRPLMMVYIPEDGSPLGAFSLKKNHITKPKDLEGKKLGAPVFDGGRQMFPVFAAVNGIDQTKINWTSVDAALREQLLMKGDLEAITGFITSAIPSLEALGVKASDVDIMRYRDFGVDGYGNALFGTRDFVEKNPKTVAAFVKAMNAALKDVITKPDEAIAALKARDGLVNTATERNRLKLYVEDTLLTAYTKSHGFSTVDTSKLDKSISDVLKAFNLTNVKMTAGSVYTDKFLPPKEERIPPMWKG